MKTVVFENGKLIEMEYPDDEKTVKLDDRMVNPVKIRELGMNAKRYEFLPGQKYPLSYFDTKKNILEALVGAQFWHVEDEKYYPCVTRRT